MGNQNSAQRPSSTPASSSTTSATASASVFNKEPTRSHSRRQSKHPISVQNHRVAAPPEQSLAQVQGSTTARPTKQQQEQQQLQQPPEAIDQHQQPPVSFASPSSGLSQTPDQTVPPKPLPPSSLGRDVLDEPSKPVAVPNSSHHSHHHSYYPQSGSDTGREPPTAGTLDTPDAGSAIMPVSSIQDMSYLTRPPRLPLPIEEEIHTPGSPIISPDDMAAGSPVPVVEPLDSEETLGRRSSALSSGAYEEEDTEELIVDKMRPTVPFRLEWPGGGDKVYVTGTIFQWNRKHRLYPVEGRPGVFAATINILPGTHHVRFLVDGLMQTSPDLPTTVDFGNNLVNYIEVSAADVEEAGAGSKTATATAELSATSSHQDMAKRGNNDTRSQLDEKTTRYKVVDPVEKFEYDIPKYLVDFDQPEDSPLYHVSVSAIEKLPTPPSLPGFLGKPILNAAVLIKDDNSVLNMPNHTVLNHLATSSIKNNILAVSATTRYKSKYVTTIIYKPTSTDG